MVIDIKMNNSKRATSMSQLQQGNPSSPPTKTRALDVNDTHSAGLHQLHYSRVLTDGATWMSKSMTIPLQCPEQSPVH